MILAEYGSDVLVLRTDNKNRCSCYNEVNQEVSRECPICLGLGYSFTAERHRIRAENSVAATQMNGALKQEDIGTVITGHRKFYTKPNLLAGERDMIVEVSWDSFGKPIYKEGAMWKITNIDTTQKLGEGKEVFKVYYAAITPVRRKIRGIRISELNGIKQYNILMEG